MHGPAYFTIDGSLQFNGVYLLNNLSTRKRRFGPLGRVRKDEPGYLISSGGAKLGNFNTSFYLGIYIAKYRQRWVRLG
ncbi:MAG: hypothetical protein CSA33_02005 [Desulfobulbus propionicus]|nr:MAG: hypothetical protein CSA33_02005 [Desulfobulbus propionicus]